MNPSGSMRVDRYNGPFSTSTGGGNSNAEISEYTPTPQQFREVVRELHNIKDYLSHIEEQRRIDLEKQSNLMYTIDGLRSQVQQQQQQLYQMESQLRYSGNNNSNTNTNANDSPNSLDGNNNNSSSNSGYPSISHSNEQDSTSRHNHNTYSRNDSHYSPRDHDMR
jgi:uncharacterized coiled-coil protein SlyX